MQALLDRTSVARRAGPLSHAIPGTDKKTGIESVVHARMNKGRAAARIKAFALGWVPVDDQPRFIEVVETELLNLHEGQRRSLSCSSNGIPQLAAVLVTSRFHQFPMIHTTDPISAFARERNIGNCPCLSQVNTKQSKPVF